MDNNTVDVVVAHVTPVSLTLGLSQGVFSTEWTDCNATCGLAGYTFRDLSCVTKTGELSTYEECISPDLYGRGNPYWDVRHERVRAVLLPCNTRRL